MTGDAFDRWMFENGMSAEQIEAARADDGPGEERVVGVHQGERVTFDGTTVRVGGLEATRDFDLNGNFRRWLAHRGVVLP